MSRLVSFHLPAASDAQVVAPGPVTTQDAHIGVISEAIPEAEAREIIERAVPQASSRHLMATGQWTWQELRDYVVCQIESQWGPSPRDPMKEKGIFQGFLNRWGAKSETIARAAFEVYGGRWNGAPIAVQRFCAGSDKFFAAVIAENI